MKRRNFLAAVTALAATGCVRDHLRKPPYDPQECPFCKMQKGVCSYCGGKTKCTFCNGKGTRRTVMPELPGSAVKKGSTLEEPCSFCGGNGICRYCSGKGRCWACDGTGRIDSWDFYSKSQELQKGKE